MSFFQNVFPWEFIGNLNLGDRQASLSWRCPANTGRGDEIVQSYGTPVGGLTFNLAGNDADGNATARLWIRYARDFENGFRNWQQIVVSIAGAVPAATTIAEIITLLNADAAFTALFIASVGNNGTTIVIRQRLPVTQFHFYVENPAAETVLLFNARAGVSELPFYFDRHTMEKRFAFADSSNHLIALSHFISGNTIAGASVITSLAHGLNTGETIVVANSNSNAVINGNQVATRLTADTFSIAQAVAVAAGTRGTWARLVDSNVIANATNKLGVNLGFTLAGELRDYQLLQGRSGLFTFTRVLTNDGTRPLRVLEYPAGATAGYVAKLLTYTWIAAAGPNGNFPATIGEEPYVLTTADLLTP